MARAWRKQNETRRREGALERLKTAKFSPKTMKNGEERSKEQWEKNRLETIANLDKKGIR